MTASHGLLPGGYWDGAGTLHRSFELVALTGHEEELLAQTRSRDTASLVTAVLARGVRCVGDIAPVTETITRDLLVADRQYLLLKLRALNFGPVVRGDVFCPWPHCGQRASLQFSLDDVPVTEPAERAPLYRMALSREASDAGTERADIVFRLPNGADQEALSPLLARNEAEALTHLLARTVRHIGAAVPGLEQIASLSALARAEIEAEMERVAPKLDLEMDTACPDCGRSFTVPFDLQRLFFGELRADNDLLYRQVHYLAYHYHWGEREIMEMTREKRLRYVELLADEIDRLNDGE